MDPVAPLHRIASQVYKNTSVQHCADAGHIHKLCVLNYKCTTLVDVHYAI